MRPARFRVLSALIVLLAALLRGSGRRAEGRSILQVDGRTTRTETLSGHRGPETDDKLQHLLLNSRDLHHKEKFIKYLAGPLYINPKCRKHFFRLYHSSRDCNIPAYYKRCARLLTRLTTSPPCAER